MGIAALPDKQQMAEEILLQETGSLIHYLSVKLPKETFAQLNANDFLKEKLYNCINGNFQGIFSRCLDITDEKKNNDSTGIEEAGVFPASGTPEEIADLLRFFSGAGLSNTGRIGKTPVPGASGSGSNKDIEIYTDSILRQKTDVGVFLSEKNICSVVKCSFTDNVYRPKTVTDVKLCINIPDSDLINPVFRCYSTIRYLIKEIIVTRIIAVIDKEIEDLEKQENTDAEAFIDGVIERAAGQDSAGFDLINIRESINKNAGIESIRSRGFSGAINSLVSILDSSKMGCQFLENIQNGYMFVIREYEDTDAACLPDEHYQITLKYLDNIRLAEDRKDYDEQIKNFKNDIQHLWDLIEVMYQDSKSVFRVNDFEDLAKKNKDRVKHSSPEWAGVSCQQKDSVRARLARMRERISNIYEFLYPTERRVMEERLAGFEKEYAHIESMLNPHTLQSGLVLDVEITSIKRKKTTVDSIAIVLEEFLRKVPGCFQDAAT